MINAQQIAAEIQSYIPNYPTLLPACVAWQAQTFVALVAQSALVAVFAGGVATQLGLVQSAVADIGDDEPVPAGSHFIDTVTFQALADQAGLFGQTNTGLAPDVDRFVAENEAADAALARIVASLPDGWASIAGPLGTLGTAFPDVGRSWDGIGTQLNALANRQVALTTVGALRRDLAATIAAWGQLRAAAMAFNEQAAG